MKLSGAQWLALLAAVIVIPLAALFFLQRERPSPTMTRIDTPPKLTFDGPVVVHLDTSLGELELALDPLKAPRTVENFVQYANSGFYEGTVFHRVIKGFMIQGGGMDSTLAEKATRASIPNEGTNGLRNDRGTIAMARTSDPNSATSQFFISLVDNTFLNATGSTPGYAVFGKVTAGLEVLDAIGNVETGAVGQFGDVPKTPVVIRKVTIAKH